MIQDVERFEPELYLVMLAIGHPEFLMSVKIQRKDARPYQRVPSHIAPGSGWRLDKSRRVVPAGGRRATQVAVTGAGCVRAVVSDARIGAVDTADSDHLRKSTLDRGDPANLPATYDSIQEWIRCVEHPPLADRQVIQHRSHEPVTLIE